MKKKPHLLVTGASSGIGASLSLLMAEQGYRVSACARRLSRLRALQEKNHRITPIEMDVSDHNSVQLGLAKAEAENGAVDIAVLNAGIYQPVNAAEFDLSSYNRHLAVNYTGILHCLDGMIRAMI